MELNFFNFVMLCTRVVNPILLSFVQTYKYININKVLHRVHVSFLKMLLRNTLAGFEKTGTLYISSDFKVCIWEIWGNLQSMFASCTRNIIIHAHISGAFSPSCHSVIKTGRAMDAVTHFVNDTVEFYKWSLSIAGKNLDLSSVWSQDNNIRVISGILEIKIGFLPFCWFINLCNSSNASLHLFDWRFNMDPMHVNS